MDYKKMWFTKLSTLIEKIEYGRKIEEGKYDPETYHFVSEGNAAQEELIDLVKIMVKSYEYEAGKLQNSVALLDEIHALEDEIRALSEENRQLKERDITVCECMDDGR